MKLKWRPVNHFRGWPFLLFEGEIMKRDYRADRFFNPGLVGEIDTGDEILLGRNTLKDWGFYTQMLYGFRKDWAAGLRYEYASGSRNNVNVDLAAGTVELVRRNSDPFRDDRYRISPLVAWHPTEFSRFRLQYNYDRLKAFRERDAHSVWLGVEFMFGAHAAHKY
jgi:outer membrane receptor protein involved in Fe transport